MAQTKRRRQATAGRKAGKAEDYEQDLDWLVEETARLRIDLARLVLTIPRAIIRLARGEGATGEPGEKDPPGSQ